jgi:hypothetical protein
MKTITILLIIACVTMGLAVAQSQSDRAEQKLSGEIMDDLCAKDKSHSGMMAQMKSMGNDPAVCSKKCAELGAKYVLYDRSSDTVYAIANPEKAEPFAGRTVHISGVLEKKKIKIATIESAAAQTPPKGK